MLKCAEAPLSGLAAPKIKRVPWLCAFIHLGGYSDPKSIGAVQEQLNSSESSTFADLFCVTSFAASCDSSCWQIPQYVNLWLQLEDHKSCPAKSQRGKRAPSNLKLKFVSSKPNREQQQKSCSHDISCALSSRSAHWALSWSRSSAVRFMAKADQLGDKNRDFGDVM